MSRQADLLLAEALGLSADERAMVASGLLASLDDERNDEDEIDRVWSIETQRRAAMLESGEAHTVTWDELQQRFAQRREQRKA